ncbi:MAG: glycosyltransferase family 90 protein [Prevotella sp.]|nr:glycosyltransferase family 90 protein [Prevotella sp.]MCM1074858.1 glycosyltransferase family 90 protein [Ruminococcus sp.]
MLQSVIQRFGSGKNVKLFYFAEAYSRRLIPRRLLMYRRKRLLKKLKRRPDFPELKQRIDYYCRIPADKRLSADSPAIGGKQPYNCAKVYLLDSEEVRRCFPAQLHWRMFPGDNVNTFSEPTIVKSRPLEGDNSCNVLLKLDRVRHFIFLHDRRRWEDKKPIALFRGRVGNQMHRLEFVKRFEGSTIIDAKCIDNVPGTPPDCISRKLTLHEQLEYKFIVCLEGNDVASNLKWVMNSNSIAVMPPPRHETWFMEGRLEPDVHYIAIKPDFCDAEERVQYYLDRPEEAARILENAHRWTAQFKDKATERMLSLAVMQNYLTRTGQLPGPPI